MNYKAKNVHKYPRENKYDKSFNSAEKIQAAFAFKPNENFLTNKSDENSKIENLNKNATPYFPHPSNEGYEIFLKVMKKELYSKTQYSLPFMLSLRDKYTERPPNMKEIKIPQKNEIRSRAKIVTEEAYRTTRNYLNENTEKRNFSIAYITKNELSDDELKVKTKSLREILNKISFENYENNLNQILKFEYDEKLLDIFKNLIFAKLLRENKYFSIYVNICVQMCKLYNKKTYSNEPKMNIKSLLLNSIQKEFLELKETSISFPFSLTPEEKKNFVQKIKISNIKLISEFYLNGIIPKKVISDCINELIKNPDPLAIELLCKLINFTYKKIITDEKDLLEIAFTYLDNLYFKSSTQLKPRTKCIIMEVLDIRDKIAKDEVKKEETALGYTADLSLGALPTAIRKNSDARTRRKSSINPKDVEYIRRSRFNSRADELKGVKDDPGLVDELVSYLGADIDFYQCFRLTEEEFDIIKEACTIFLKKFSVSEKEINYNEIKQEFVTMMDEVQCEKFIVVGHLLEIMFSKNSDDAMKIMEIIEYFFKKGFIIDEDIKHGIVLGLVNFRNNIIDYPNTREYFQNFINMIKKNEIIDEKLLKVYQRTCDNLEKCYE